MLGIAEMRVWKAQPNDQDGLAEEASRERGSYAARTVSSPNG